PPPANSTAPSIAAAAHLPHLNKMDSVFMIILIVCWLDIRISSATACGFLGQLLKLFINIRELLPQFRSLIQSLQQILNVTFTKV
ncbi:MAG: hypothetical protein MR793_07465, partial [Bacteroidales bacterium]|nr:hypothetical protein [Bacteroidales bacterium]